jgi:hypothetical protein
MRKRVGHQRPEQDPFDAKKYRAIGQGLKQLLEATECPAMWPKNLFTGQDMTAEEILAEVRKE